MDAEFTNALFGFVWLPGQEGPDDGGHATAGDRGGFTRLGITAATWTNWCQANGLGTLDIRQAPLGELASIYYAWYWKPVSYISGPSPGVRFSLFDFGITAGPRTAIRQLQQILTFTGKDLDGMMGPYTCAKASVFDQPTLINALAGAQSAYYQSLADYERFGNGWRARTLRRRTTAIGLSAFKNSVFGSAHQSDLYRKYLSESA